MNNNKAATILTRLQTFISVVLDWELTDKSKVAVDSS